MWGWIIGGVLGLIALISYVQYRAANGSYKSLSSRQPERAQEGFQASPAAIP
jgi:hypothetical protein